MNFPVDASIRHARHPHPTIPLALTEARRLAFHPLTVVGLTVTVVVTVLSLHRGPGTTFDAVTAAPTFYFGLFVIFASNLITTRDGRSGAIEMLTATPTPTARRTLALISAAPVPAACCAVLVLLADAYLRATDRYVVAPNAWYLAQGPLTILGAALLGILVARWLPYRAAPYLVVVSIIIGNVITSNHPETIHALGLYVAWERFVPSGGWAGLYPGSVVLHTGYLVGLSALAGICALAHDAPRRRRYLLAASATLAVTAVSAWTQLP